MTEPAPAAGHPTEPSSPDRPNPYVGPRAFRLGETIYGRSHEIADVRDVLIAKRVVLLYSPSGAGKSSLIEAGLRPELAAAGFRLFATIRVGTEPPSALGGHGVRNRYVLSVLASLEEGRPAERQLPPSDLATVELGSYFDQLVDDPVGHDSGATEPCFVFDQFEELFTLDPTDLEAKQSFLRELGVALRDRSRWALFAMREDFIAQLDPFLALLPTRLASRYRLDLLDPAAARLAAQRPAEEQGVAFTDAAANRLIEDLCRVRVQRGAVSSYELGPHVEPVQLQVVCRQLWNTLDPDASAIEEDDVDALGDVDDALADYYVQQIEAVSEHTGVSEREIRTWFDERLITPDGFRTQVLEGPGATGPAVLRELENAHLIRTDRRRGTEWYELSHDRLVPPIQAANARWREAHLHPLQRAAQDWDVRSRPQGLLITGDVLDEAEEWAHDHETELLAVDHDYLEACRAEQRRLDLERRVARRNRVLAVAATAVGILALAGLVYVNQLRASAAREKAAAERATAAAEEALRQQQQAEAAQARLDASNAWLAAGAQADEPRAQLLAWRLAFEANPDNTSAELARKLTTAQHYLAHDPAYVGSARALDPSGTMLARGTPDGRVELVDIGTLERTQVTDLDPVEAIAFDPTGDLLAVAAGGSITFFDGATPAGQISLPETGEGQAVQGLSLAGGTDGLVAAVLADPAGNPGGRLVVWEGGTEIESPVDAEIGVARAVLSGSSLAAVTQSGLRVWSRSDDSWTEVTLDGGGPPAVAATTAVTFSPDGALVAIGTAFGPEVYSLLGPGGAPPSQPSDAPYERQPPPIIGLAFPGGTTMSPLRTIDSGGQVADWVLTGSGDWQRVNGKVLRPGIEAQMSTDGARAVIGDRVSSAVFDAVSGAELIGQFAAAKGSSAGGRSVVVGAAGQVDEQAATGGPWRRGRASSDTVDAALSPDGHLLARLVGSTGVVGISEGDGAEATVPSCTGTTQVASTASLADDPPSLGLSVADNAAAAAFANLRNDPVGDPQSAWCALPVAGGSGDGLPYTSLENSSLVGETYRAVATSGDGVWFTVGTDLNGGGTVDLYPIDDGILEVSQPLPNPVTAVALTSGVGPTLVAGDERGNLVVYEATGAVAADAVEPPGPGARCDLALPVTDRTVAVAIGERADGQEMVAAATPKAVFVYEVAVADAECARLIGGFDLLRDEGTVLDVAIDGEGRVTVLESDLNVFTFDPAMRLGDVAADVRRRSAQRGWQLTTAECQAATGSPDCPS